MLREPRRHAVWCRTPKPKLQAAPPDVITEAALDAHLAAAAEDALAELADKGELWGRAEQVAPARWPPDLRACLARALALGSPPTRAALWAHHLELMPRERVAVLASTAEPQATLMHTPLELGQMPRLAAALAGLFAGVRAAGIAPERVFGCASPEALIAARPTLADVFGGVYYGGHGPPIYTSAVDLAAYRRELVGESARAVIERRLVAPFVHELSHFQPARVALFPPYLDECLAGWIGVLAYPGLAYPPPGEDGALCLAPAFGQVGDHLMRLFGKDALVAAHAGVRGWREVFPDPLVGVWERMAWEQWLRAEPVHFLGEPGAAAPWLKAAWLAAAGALPADAGWDQLVAWPWSAVPVPVPTAPDAALVRRAILALSLTITQTPEGAWRVARRATDARIRIDWEACDARLVGGGGLGASLRMVLSPALAAVMRARGNLCEERAADPWCAAFEAGEG